LNNALKYAVHKIIVSLRKDATSFTVIVSSDGEKIPKDLSQQIFEPFYQINNKKNTTSGAGIGLPLSRSLAELHTGQLFLDTGAEMNSFVLILPLNQEKVMDIGELPVQGEYIRADEKEEVIQTTDYIILLVEDNEQMLSFVSEKLKEHFVVETALNGEEALEIMKDRPVDIVITDVMMPVMNGMQLCRAIKTNVEYNHIPVIFLTAKNDLDSKIKGLEMGADAYIEKPFSFNYLEVQVITLLNNRRKEREAFSRKPFFPVHNMHMNKTDEEFLNKIILIIQKNITDDNFNVEHLAEILGMSRSSLLRKIKVLTTLSPVDFIKVIRLKRAAELIAGGEYRIGEICYMVGINSPSYFSKLFFKQFGVTPKDFEKNNNTSSSGK
jgi:two-component system sensor histidine kinase/response regulator, hybrid